MTVTPAQGPAATEGAHLVLFDGVCGLCSRLVPFLLEHDRRRVFSFASLQSKAGREVVERSGGDPDALTSFYVLANYRTSRAQMSSRSAAVLFVAGQLGWPWNIAAVGRILPTAIRDRLYDAVARNRYRVFGSNQQCLTPRPEFRERFID